MPTEWQMKGARERKRNRQCCEPRMTIETLSDGGVVTKMMKSDGLGTKPHSVYAPPDGRIGMLSISQVLLLHERGTAQLPAQPPKVCLAG